MSYSLNPPYTCFPNAMIEKYPLFEEINKNNNHVCIHSDHCCEFCMTKIRVQNEPIADENITYILPSEVALHNTADNCWVSYLGKVFDITPVINNHKDEKCIRPLLAFAGKDISHWFNDDGDIRHYVHPVTGAYVPYCPYGSIPDVHAVVPATSWTPVPNPPWWKNKRYMVGLLTKKSRHIKITNMLTKDECLIEVCMEDKIRRIQERYKLFNGDFDSYTWCFEDHVLDLDKNLELNGIPDERERFLEVGLPENTYIPMILLYYNDDLKWELPI